MLKVFKNTELNDSIGVVMGTRPGIIKLSPVVRALDDQGCHYFIIHTGQHYSYNMDKQFFEELELPEPRYKITSTQHYKLHGAQTAEMLKGVEQALIKERPWVVIVGGDANTNLAGALAARKLGIAVAHVEAGLRSGDWRMPEEHNRVMIDHISEFLFPPTEQAKDNLVADNVAGKIKVVGNTIVDAIYQNLELAKKRDTLQKLGLSSDYLLVTLHREENVDSQDILADIIEGLRKVANEINKIMIFPIHPRTKKRLRGIGLERKVNRIKNLCVIDPVGYLDFLQLLSKALLVLTDSGGIQEESCILKIPCVTLRDDTERPETVQVGANIIAGTHPNDIVEAAKKMLSVKRQWDNPFGDGQAGLRIVRSLLEERGLQTSPLGHEANR